MKEHCCIYDIHRDCVTRVLDKKSFTWNNPRFQGGLQAFGGAAEAVIGGGIALGSGGIGASVGWPVLAHGLDQFITGMSMAITGKRRETLTEQLLATTGMPPEWALFTNDMLTISGTMGGSAIN